MTRTQVHSALIAVLVAAVLGLAFAFAHVSVQLSHQSAIQGRDQRSNTAALCALRTDLQNRVTQGRAYLVKHPHGILGIPANTIRASLDNEQATLTALQPVRCP